jgi:N-acetyltransferase
MSSPATMSIPLERVTLEGRLVRLEPMSPAHLDGLAKVAFDPSIWVWTIARPTDRAGLEAWMSAAIANCEAGTELPFVTVDRATGDPIGSSRYLNIVPEHRRLEIGWTWVATGFQRAGANREAKLLMIEHAIEGLGCHRVEFKTDSRNEKSRAALLGIGATFEGIFRNHMVMPDGPLRHSAYYSVIDDEWSEVKARLVASVDAIVAGAEPPRE